MASSQSIAFGGIYAIRHIESGKMYIGSAVDFSIRWRAHRLELGNGEHHSRYLRRAWHKYGPKAFVFEILEFVEDPGDREQFRLKLIGIEQQYLDDFQPWRAEIGYNTCRRASSVLGLKHSPKTRAKLSAILKGRTLSAEHRRALSEARKGRVFSPETRAKISAAQRGRKLTPERRIQISLANSNRKVSAETRAKMSAAHKKRYESPEERAKTAAAAKGVRHSPEARANISKAQRERYRLQRLADWWGVA